MLASSRTKKAGPSLFPQGSFTALFKDADGPDRVRLGSAPETIVRLNDFLLQ